MADPRLQKGGFDISHTNFEKIPEYESAEFLGMLSKVELAYS